MNSAPPLIDDGEQGSLSVEIIAKFIQRGFQCFRPHMVYYYKKHTGSAVFFLAFDQKHNPTYFEQPIFDEWSVWYRNAQILGVEIKWDFVDIVPELLPDHAIRLSNIIPIEEVKTHATRNKLLLS